jgi:integrase/recombinase XerC
VDWTRNPKAPEFGNHGALSVRWAKSLPGGPPRRRTVLTVFGWAVEVVEEYLGEVRPRYDFEGLAAMWPTERGGCMADGNVSKMFAALRDEAGLPKELGPHCLRHSYVTHLIEDGFDPLFVQQQVGHYAGDPCQVDLRWARYRRAAAAGERLSSWPISAQVWPWSRAS